MGSPATTSSRPSSGAPEVRCGACQRRIDSLFYTADGRTVCPSCRLGLREQAEGDRLPRAFGLGALAAAAGALTGTLLGRVSPSLCLLALVGSGALVGLAVRRGAGARGGRRLQTLALVLSGAALACIDGLGLAPGLSRAGSPGASAAGSLALALHAIPLLVAWHLNGRRAAQIQGPFRIPPRIHIAVARPPEQRSA